MYRPCEHLQLSESESQQPLVRCLQTSEESDIVLVLSYCRDRSMCESRLYVLCMY